MKIAIPTGNMLTIACRRMAALIYAEGQKAMDESAAAKILEKVLRFSDPISDLTELSEAIPAIDGKEIRRHLGVIMVELDEIMRPILRRYPHLDPDR